MKKSLLKLYYKIVFRTPIIEIIYITEAFWAKLLRKFGIRKDTSFIPKGSYCYTHDEERENREPAGPGSFWVKPCKYYRSIYKSGKSGCTYIGFFDWDLLLNDQCKICGINDYTEEELENMWDK